MNLEEGNTDFKDAALWSYPKTEKVCWSKSRQKTPSAAVNTDNFPGMSSAKPSPDVMHFIRLDLVGTV